MEGAKLIVLFKGCLHIPSPLCNVALVHSVVASARHSICSQIKKKLYLFYLELTDVDTGRQMCVPATRKGSPLHPPSAHFSAECKWQVALIHQGPADLSNKRRRAVTRGCCQIRTEAGLLVRPAPVPAQQERPASPQGRDWHLFLDLLVVEGCWWMSARPVSAGCRWAASA